MKGDCIVFSSSENTIRMELNTHIWVSETQSTACYASEQEAAEKFFQWLQEPGYSAPGWAIQEAREILQETKEAK